MAMAQSNKFDEDRLRVVRETRPSSTRGELEKAQELALQIEQLLATVGGDVPDSDTFRVRLARAHALSLLDELSVLLRPARGPSGAPCAPRETDEDASSTIRPVTSWR